MGGGILGSGIANGIFGGLTNVSGMMCIWFLNGFFQSFIWAPMVRFISEYTTQEECTRICLILSTTGPAGMTCAYGYSALCLRWWNWRWCFRGTAAFAIITALFWFFGTVYIKHNCLYEKREYKSGQKKAGCSGISFRKICVQSGLMGIMASACIHGMLKDGLTTWIPTYFVENFHTSAVSAVLLTMLLPVINLAGVFWADYWNRSRFYTEMKTVAVFYGVSLIAVLLMIVTQRSLLFSGLLFALVTTAMTGMNTLIISIIPLYFRKSGRVSTVIGILNASIYAGTALASYGFGVIAEGFGWKMLRVSWCFCAAAGMAVSFRFRKKWHEFRRE